MDIHRDRFWQELPSILKIISEAQYISMDLEMSGITAKKRESSSPPKLQKVYEDARHAAQAFTVLQVGLTCIAWEEEKDSYTTRTFNFPLTPGIISEDAASQQLAHTVDRHVMLSSKTLAFLHDHGFNFDTVFERGIPYLSTAEAASEETINFLENRNLSGEYINIEDCTQGAKAFYYNVRAQIHGWIIKKAYEENPSQYLHIKPPYDGRLNHLQKRLVYQLVETEFKDYRVQSKAGSSYMRVMEWDATEDSDHRRIKAQRRQAVAKQRGWAYIWDAICGRLFADKIDVQLVVGEDPVKIIEIRQDLRRYERRLRNNRPIIVGHNMLLDLCFLQSTFVTPLPDDVVDFQRLVGEGTPRIIDTKYLFTRGAHEMMPDQNLKECFSAVRAEKYPSVRPDTPYGYVKESLHQAGYDSYMTAVVFLKKSYQLAQAKHGLSSIPAEDFAASHSPTAPAPALAARFSPNLATLATRFASDAPGISRAIGSTSTGSLLDEDDEDAAVALCGYQPLRPGTPAKPPKLTPPEAPSGAGPESTSPARVPEWEAGHFWKKYGNKVRTGQPGLILYTGGTVD